MSRAGQILLGLARHRGATSALFACAILQLLIAPAAASQPGAAQRTLAAFTASVTSNVATLNAGDRIGFGFIVALGARSVVVATARHTFSETSDGSAEVCFPLRGTTCARGEVVYVADAIGKLPELDLAFVEVAYPVGLMWRPDVDGGRAVAGSDVLVSGRAGEWYIPDHAGTVITDGAEDSMVRYRGLDVAAGVSGAPIIAKQGIVAMHTQEIGKTLGAEGLPLSEVRARLEQFTRFRWLLVPLADCAKQEPSRADLSDRRIVMQFLPGQPDAAMRATAQLICLGAHVELDPVWDDAGRFTTGVTYGRGDIRVVRAIQSALASFGRLDARLETSSSDLIIRVR